MITLLRLVVEVYTNLSSIFKLGKEVKMKKKKEDIKINRFNIFNKWTFLVVLLICLTIIIIKFYDCNIIEYEYEVKYLNNDNEIYYDVVEYMCSDNVKTTRFMFNNYLYISTYSEDANGDNGVCLLKKMKKAQLKN